MRRKATAWPGKWSLDALPGITSIRAFDDAYTAPFHGFRDAADYYHRASAMRIIERIRLPALVITGRYDINVAPSVAYRIHKAIPGSRFAVFERSGHLPFFEEPREFVSLLEAFLAGK